MMIGPDDITNRAIMEKLTTLTDGMGEIKQRMHGLEQDVQVLKQGTAQLTEVTQGIAQLTEVTQGIMRHMDRNHASTTEGFAQFGREFALLRGEMNHRFDGVYDRLDRVDVRLDRLEAKRRRPKNRE
jgi:hypothetical protein